MKYSLLFEAFYYPAFYTLFFAMYQMKGYHSNLPEAGGNLAMAIIILIVYLVFFLWILYVSAKTREKISKVEESLKKN
jgi:ABC-type transport system involved in multi-copper enzyme maturation permease subunit